MGGDLHRPDVASAGLKSSRSICLKRHAWRFMHKAWCMVNGLMNILMLLSKPSQIPANVGDSSDPFGVKKPTGNQQSQQSNKPTVGNPQTNRNKDTPQWRIVV